MNINKSMGFHFTKSQSKKLKDMGWSFDGNGTGDFGECYKKAILFSDKTGRQVVPYFIDIQQGIFYLYSIRDNYLVDISDSDNFNEILDELMYI